MLYINIDISPGQGTHQLGAGGHGGTAVTEKAAGENSSSCKGGIQTRCIGYEHADDSHGAGGTKGSACEEGHHGAQQKRAQYKVPRIDKPHGMIQDEWYGPAGAPYGCKGTDKQENEKDVLHLPHPLYEHAAGRLDRIPL